MASPTTAVLALQDETAAAAARMSSAMASRQQRPACRPRRRGRFGHTTTRGRRVWLFPVQMACMASLSCTTRPTAATEHDVGGRPPSHRIASELAPASMASMALRPVSSQKLQHVAPKLPRTASRPNTNPAMLVRMGSSGPARRGVVAGASGRPAMAKPLIHASPNRQSQSITQCGHHGAGAYAHRLAGCDTPAQSSRWPSICGARARGL